MKKRVLTFFALLFVCCAGVQGQERRISVAEFRLLENDMTANTYGTEVEDQNGEKCALIKVETTEKGFSFEVGSLGVTKVEDNHPGEIWVYVPHGITRISIFHPTLGVLRDYQLPIQIVSSRTYLLKLTTGKIYIDIEEAVTQQWVVFKVFPENAVVELNNEILDVNGGIASKFVNFGVYDYRVQAANYHADAGRIEVNDPKQKVERQIKLKPAFGSLEISGDGVAGAKVYLDNQYMGSAPIRCDEVASGEHNVKLAKVKYKSYEKRIRIEDEKHLNLTPELLPNFSHITFRVDDFEAEIWINGERKGVGEVSDDFEEGVLQIECRKENHRTVTSTKQVVAGMPASSVPLPSPIPIYGSLNLTSTPMDASVYIDDEYKGKTPLFLPRILIGEHTVKLSKSSYADKEERITIVEDKPATVNVTLQNGRPIRIVCQQPGARIYVDGKDMGPSPYEGMLSFGRHTAYAMRDGKRSAEQSIDCPQGDGMLPQVELSFIVTVNVTCNASTAQLYLDGKYLGRGSGLYRMTVGSHTLTATAGGYYDYSKELRVDEDMSLTVNLRSGWTFVTASALGSTAPQLAAGLTFGQVWSVGWYMSVGTNFAFDFPSISQNYSEYFFTGEARRSYLTVVAGMVSRIGTRVWLNVGAGYGTRRLGQYTDDGQLIEVSYNRYQGLTFDAGATLRLGRFLITAGAQMIRDGEREESFGMAKAGVGFCF